MHKFGEKNDPLFGMKQARVWLVEKRVFHWLVFGLCILAIWHLTTYRMPRQVITYGDSVQYWAAGRLLISGQNPYSSEQVLKLRAEVGTYTDFPPNAISKFLYPPWGLLFALPLGPFSYPAGRMLWFIFHLVVIFLCSRWIWQLYRGPKELHWVAYIVAFSFTPVLFLLLMGHFTTLHLLGLIAFLYFISRTDASAWSDLAAGACAALVTFKPQLLFLFMIALLLWVIKQRRWFVLAGGAGYILLASSIALAFDPQVFAEYWIAFSTYPVDAWASPALGIVLRTNFGYQRAWLQLLPPLLGLVWFIFYWVKHHRQWDWLAQMPVLVLVSVLTSSYLWSYDMVVLLLPILQVSIALIKTRNHVLIASMFTIYLGINALRFYQFLIGLDDYNSFWLVPALLAWWLLGNHLSHPEPTLQLNEG